MQCSSAGVPFATVDHTDAGNTIKLTKDEQGQHHRIPTSWVTRVDEHVHVDRPGKPAMQRWSSTAPEGAETVSARASQTTRRNTATSAESLPRPLIVPGSYDV